MQRVLFAVLILFVTVLDLQVESSLCKFEGILGSPVENINNMNLYAAAFLPYNPVIVEIGAYEGKGTLSLSQAYPHGKIFAFEPQPKAYSMLEENMQLLKNTLTINLALNAFNGTASLWGNGLQASLLRSWDKEFQVDVPCVVLDDWCKYNGITHIDFLRLDAGGLEWQILQSSPEILKTVLVIVTKTYMYSCEQSIPSYPLLKEFLENQDFKLLSHWYKDEGEAVFVRKCMYNSIFE